MFRSGLLAVLVALVALVTMSSAGTMPAQALNAGALLPGDPALVNLLAAEQAMLDLTNDDRIANGVEPLQLDADTLSIARQRAESQLGPQSLTHYDANGQLIFSRLLNDASLPYGLAGENLARATGPTETNLTQRVEQALMHSPLHRKNILERVFRRVAIGAAVDANGQIAFAEVFRD